MKTHTLCFLLIVSSCLTVSCSSPNSRNLSSDDWNRPTRKFHIETLPFLVIGGNVGAYFDHITTSCIQGLCTEEQFRCLIKVLHTQKKEQLIRDLKAMKINYVFNKKAEEIGFIPLVLMLTYLKHPPSPNSPLIFWELFRWNWRNIVEGKPPSDLPALIRVFSVTIGSDGSLVAYELSEKRIEEILGGFPENLKTFEAVRREARKRFGEHYKPEYEKWVILPGSKEKVKHKKIALVDKEFNVILYRGQSLLKNGWFDIALPGFFVIDSTPAHGRFFSSSSCYIVAGGLWMVCAPAFDFLWENPAPEKGFSPKGLDWFRDDPLYKRYVCGE